jgi:CRP-like cAMP-binding protein
MMHTDEYTPLRKFISRILDVSESEWRAHRDLLTRRFLKKGEFLIRAGQICNYVSFVNTGSLRVYRETDGHEITKHFFFENEYATEYASFLTRTPTALDIKTMEDTELIELGYDKMQRLYEQYPAWQKYGRLMAENIFLTSCERAQDLLYLSPEQLYLKLMRDSPQILSRIPQHYIASYMGIQPESLSRIRKRLAMETKNVNRVMKGSPVMVSVSP